MKRKTIIDSAMALKKLADIDLPAKIAIKIFKIMNKIQPILDEYTGANKILMKKFGEISKNGMAYDFPMPGSAAEYQEARDEYLDEEIKDFDIEMIPLQKFGSSLKTIKPSMLFSLSWLIETDDEDESETKKRKKTKRK